MPTAFSLLIALVLGYPSAAFLALQGPQATGVLEGTVTQQGSAKPVANARIAIWGDHGPDFTTTTDINGHYIFPELPPGVYNMEAQADGYVTVPDPGTGAGVRVTVNNQQRARWNILMPSISAITGRILDDKSEPLDNVPVEVLRLRYGASGRPEWQGAALTTTNEKGEYRAEDLPAGEYYIRGKNAAKRSVTYFPGTSDPRAAVSVLLREGEERHAEFSLASAGTYSISGTIVDPDRPAILARLDAFTPEKPVMLYAIPQDLKIPVDRIPSEAMFVKEEFQYRGLLPGIYDLYAVRPMNRVFTMKASIDPATGKTFFIFDALGSVTFPLRVAKATVEVRDEDVKDIKLAFEPGADVLGHIRVAGGDGTALPLVAKNGLVGPVDVTLASNTIEVRLNLEFKEDFIKGLIAPSITRVSENSFTFADVPAGVYSVSVTTSSPSPNFYVADIREGARSVFDDGLRVTHQAIDSLDVLLGFDGGAVTGNLLGTSKSSAFIVLAPQVLRRSNRALFKTVTLEDASNPFNFSEVAPGLYSLFAFELVSVDDTLPYLDPNFLSLYETRGTPVTIERNAVVGPLQIPLIKR
jgi:Carboxypeptidase regulatory-like domain